VGFITGIQHELVCNAGSLFFCYNLGGKKQSASFGEGEELVKMKVYEIIEHHYETEPSYIMKDHEANALAELVPGIGNHMIRFEVQGKQVIQPPPNMATLLGKPARFAVPILFPPNRIFKATYSYKGRTYTFPKKPGTDYYIHGELKSKPWIVIETGADEQNGVYIISTFRYIDHPEMFEHYAHALVFTLTYRLYKGELTCTLDIHNEGEDEAPLAVGYHPYFKVNPEHEITIVIPSKQEWPISDDAFVTGMPASTEFSRMLSSGMDLKRVNPTRHLLEMPRAQNNKCEIRDRDEGTKIVFESSVLTAV
jgi:galactose mutarotase-like enzyme